MKRIPCCNRVVPNMWIATQIWVACFVGKIIAFQLFVFHNVQLLHVDVARGEMGPHMIFVCPNFFNMISAFRKNTKKFFNLRFFDISLILAIIVFFLNCYYHEMKLDYQKYLQ